MQRKLLIRSFPSRLEKRLVPNGDLRSFTLVETLVVLAIIGIMTALALSTLSGFVNSHTMSQTVYQVSGALEQARHEAMSRQTYVWVGFLSTTNNGIGEVQIGSVYSKDGTGNNVTPANLQNLNHVIHISNATIVNWNQLKSATRALYTNSAPAGAPNPMSVITNSMGIVFTSGASQFNTGETVTFTPQGEALLKGNPGPDDGYDPFIDVSFVQLRGTVSPANPDDAAVVIDGSTGSVKSIRIQ